MDLALVDYEMRVALQRQLHHRQAVRRTGMGRVAVRRRAARDEADGTEAALFKSFLREPEMPEVDRVERAA
jgi:hypothetical protein